MTTDAERAREIILGLPLWKMIDDEIDADVVEAVIKGVESALAAVRTEEREALAAEFERKADAVPIAQTIDFNGFAQSEFNLLMWAARAIRRQEG